MNSRIGGIAVGEFLPDYDDRLPWSGKKSFGSVLPLEVLRGSSETALAVVVAQAPAEPSRADLLALWKARAGQSVDPVLVCVQYEHAGEQSVAVLGPDREAVPVSGLERALAERLVGHALEIESPTGLVAELRRKLATLRGGVGPGFRNEGLFAAHVLSQQPSRPDWAELCANSLPLLARRGEQLLTGLGFKVERVPDGVVLRVGSNGNRRAAAVLLLDDESLDNPLARFHGYSAVTHGLALARKESVPWLIVLGGGVARLFPANPDVGVGRKGQTQTYVEVDLDLLSASSAGYLALLFSPDALSEGGSVTALLAESSKYAVDLSIRLRDRVYENVIPNLAVAVAAHRDVWSVPEDEQREALDEAYHQAMIVLFRLLFVAYAEDRQLLPLDINQTYTSNALKTLARRILEDPSSMASQTSTSIWDDLCQVWKVIDRGDLEGMGVPAYNGGLFTSDPKKNPSGAATYDLELTNAEIGPVIAGLMIDKDEDDVLGLVDFRSLDVREFGTIYEGLLESGLGIADTDLTVDTTDTYVPASDGDEVIIDAGDIYFHSRSGSRKATGSYFTKPFAVQHLLNTALEPALADHLGRVTQLVKRGSHRSAAEALFDFRVADLSMGSAHFLVAAIDRIEARFSEFLSAQPLPEVAQELHALRMAAAAQLAVDVDSLAIDDGVLLRRQIARRCIYGVDINEIAVELARLAVWIHTFVPGLPLSFLNHGLIHGNSLTGVGTLSEIVESLEQARTREDKSFSGGGLFGLDEPLRQLLDRAGRHLTQLGALSDASVADVSEAGQLQSEIASALEPLSALCDLITAERTTRHLKTKDPEKFLLVSGAGNNLTMAMSGEELEAAILAHPQLQHARAVARSVQATHMPTRFAEVFRREPAGFDCLLGNPPWEKLKPEVSRWWALRFPGLRSLPQGEQDRKVSAYRLDYPDLAQQWDDEVQSIQAARRTLVAGPYPGIGNGDPDLYQAFAWRFINLLRQGGRMGVVVPRSLLSENGTAQWRSAMFESSEWTDVTILVNSGRWAFEQIHPQYTIALLANQKTGKHSNEVHLRGPVHSQLEFERAATSSPIVLPAREFREFGSGDAFPLLTSQIEADAYRQFRKHPRLDADFPDTWRVRPYAEFHATADKPLFVLDRVPEGNWKLFKGESFNLWNPDTGIYYGSVSPDVVQVLQEKRKESHRRADSPFSEFASEVVEDPATLPILNPRIAIRLVARATDSRTFICALVPPKTALTHGAPYLLMPRGSSRDVAYLLGVLSSMPFDWLARRTVEVNLTYHVINGLTVPRVDEATGGLMSPTGSVTHGEFDARILRNRLIEISGRLASVDDRFADWADEVGVPVASVAQNDERLELQIEADALAALLYGLSPQQTEHVFSSFQRGWDYSQRLETVLQRMEHWVEVASQRQASS